jgi:hypothetical protein
MSPPHLNTIQVNIILQESDDIYYFSNLQNRISGVIVSVLTLCMGLGQTKDYKIVICCFSAEHTALRNTSEKRYMSSDSCKIMFPCMVFIG